MGEVQYNFEADVKEVTEQMWTALTTQYVNDETNPKHSVVYLYDDDKGAHFMFKALSSDRWLAKDFVFFALAKPTEKMTLKNQLPMIAGAFRKTSQYKVGQTFQLANLDFDDVDLRHLRQALLGFEPEISKDYDAWYH